MGRNITGDREVSLHVAVQRLDLYILQEQLHHGDLMGGNNTWDGER